MKEGRPLAIREVTGMGKGGRPQEREGGQTEGRRDDQCVLGAPQQCIHMVLTSCQSRDNLRFHMTVK